MKKQEKINIALSFIGPLIYGLFPFPNHTWGLTETVIPSLLGVFIISAIISVIIIFFSNWSKKDWSKVFVWTTIIISLLMIVVEYTTNSGPRI